MVLKVHKNDNFFGSDFEFFTIFAFTCLNIKILWEKKFDLAIIQEDTIFPHILSIRWTE